MTLNEQLQALFRAILPHNRFQAKRLEAANVNGAISTVEEFCARVPFTHKDDLVSDQSQQPPYGTNLTYPLERYTRYCQTTGTTGRPLAWLDTTEDWEWLL